MSRRLADEDYGELLRFRDGLRGFLRWSATQAAKEGLTPTQHQLLLAIRGHEDPLGPTVGAVAEHLLLRHHSAVELIDRAVLAGLVVRGGDPGDGRAVRLRLTDLGQEKLAALAALHLEELRRLTRSMTPIWEGLGVTVEGRAPSKA